MTDPVIGILLHFLVCNFNYISNGTFVNKKKLFNNGHCTNLLKSYSWLNDFNKKYL